MNILRTAMVLRRHSHDLNLWISGSMKLVSKTWRVLAELSDPPVQMREQRATLEPSKTASGLGLGTRTSSQTLLVPLRLTREVILPLDRPREELE